MTFVRSPRGAKTRFSVARVAHSITQVYVGALGPRTTQHRARIQEHAQAVYLALRGQLGEAAGVEWSRAAIRQAIETELRQRAPAEVHEFFLEEEDKRAKRERSLPKEGWGRFEAMPETNPDRVDPVWAIVAQDDSPTETATQSRGALDQLGVATKPAKAKKTNESKPEAARRSQWLAWFRLLARQVTHAFDFEAFERQLLKLPPDLRSLPDTGWWGFWQEQVQLAMKHDPRAVGMLRVMHELRERSRVLGHSWLAASGLPGATAQTHKLSDDREGVLLYQRLWSEHIRKLARGPEGDKRLLDFDLDKLAAKLDPQRDRHIDWRGSQWLGTTECLWSLPFEEWNAAPGQTPDPLARELPQWAWMRVAMGLSVLEKDPTVQAMVFYDAFSSLAVLPSETMLREAGKAAPRYLEDEAGLVHDEFESIHQSIHRAAINTKWTGTIALDWREVRAQGAPIAGRRISQGPIGFLRSIHSSLAAQGRYGEDRPVTVALPLWHRDIEGFLDLRHTDGARLQTVVTIPDLFFERLQTGLPWVLFDPAAYPEVSHGGEQGYLQAEARWQAEGQKNHLHAKAIGADKLWRLLVKAMQKGSPFVTFEGSDKAFAPFPVSAPPVGGIDGVGAMPVPSNQETAAVSWPSMAVDLSRTLDSEGNPDPDRMKQTAAIAMRALDNAIEASRLPEGSATLDYRPVCLGAVGFFEAINKGSSSSQNDPELVTAWVSGLAEAWSAVVLLADQQLRRERGAAKAWKQAPDARPFDPMGSIERMKLARKGSLGHKPTPQQDWNPTRFRNGHRCSVRTVWAPYQGAAKIAGVTPGGMGTLRPVDLVMDEEGKAHWCPTPLIMELLRQRPEDAETLRDVLRYPQQPRKWPEFVQALTFPTVEGWERRLLHAAHIRPWIDQGVSLTLPIGLAPETLGPLVRRAWWLGLSNVRFEGLYPEADAMPDNQESVDNQRNHG